MNGPGGPATPDAVALSPGTGSADAYAVVLRLVVGVFWVLAASALVFVLVTGRRMDFGSGHVPLGDLAAPQAAGGAAGPDPPGGASSGTELTLPVGCGDPATADFVTLTQFRRVHAEVGLVHAGDAGTVVVQAMVDGAPAGGDAPRVELSGDATAPLDARVDGARTVSLAVRSTGPCTGTRVRLSAAYLMPH